MNETQSKHTGRKYTVILFLVIGLTAISSAVKQWQEIVTATREIGELISSFSSAVVPTANARTSCSLNAVAQNTEEFRWSGTIAPGKAIEIKNINGEISAQPSTSNQVEVLAHKRSRRGDVSMVQIKVVEHANGVTICALYPTEDGSLTTCEPGEVSKSTHRGETRKNDVSVDFEVRVPAGVDLVARTVNGDVSATSLQSNVTTRTINGSITVSTTGYADASTINGGITAKLGNGNWSGPLSFTTVNGEIAVALPANISADVEAQTLNGSIQSDFPLTMDTVNTSKTWKHIRGKIGSGGRELKLKTLNGSINLRTSQTAL